MKTNAENQSVNVQILEKKLHWQSLTGQKKFNLQKIET